MSISVIISICLLLLLAYIFDISSSRTKIPSVILLLLLGWLVRQATTFFSIPIPNLTSILPILGTLGLILIVLEGSLELEINKSKYSVIAKTTVLAILPMLLFSFILAFVLKHAANVPFKTGLANAIPFAIISSAIAIPSAYHLISKDKEFVTYESSMSDIFGVIFFNFITLNETIDSHSIGYFVLNIAIILVITFVATLGLTFLLSKIKHHVKFIPIILIIVLIYTITKIIHLPGLIFILLFGLFIGNLRGLKRLKIMSKFQPDILEKEVPRFNDLTVEAAFLVRTLFFLLFGYLIETHELLNEQTAVWALGICIGIFLIRYILLQLLRIRLSPILFIAPRGLITILLFLSIPVSQSIGIVSNSLVIQVVILSAILMMGGLILHKTKIESADRPNPEKEELEK